MNTAPIQSSMMGIGYYIWHRSETVIFESIILTDHGEVEVGT
jgi:hypothetical protein